MDRTQLLKPEELKIFASVYDELVDGLIEEPEFVDMKITMNTVREMLDYNVPDGKQNRGILCASAYRQLSTNLSDENVHLSYVLAWCIEILQASFLVIDDFMDKSLTRRDKPCWYKTEGVGVSALNDGILLENILYAILKKYFATQPYYPRLLELFHDLTLRTALGQSLDTRTAVQKDFSRYNLELYRAITKYKTSYYSFYLPAALAMTMAGIQDESLFSEMETVTLELGHLFQIQDDFLDLFGEINLTGKIGTDIQDAKCSWFVVTALQDASDETKNIIFEQYGHDDPDKVAVVKTLFENLGLPQLYKEHETKLYEAIQSHIQDMSQRLPKELLKNMLDRIYQRER